MNTQLSELTTDRFFPIDRQQSQDWKKLESYLAERDLHFSSTPAPRQFAGGFGNLNYLLTIDGEPCVLRRPPLGRLPPGANDMTREYRVTSQLWQRFPLAPRAILLCEQTDVLGAKFLIMQYRKGAVIHQDLPTALHPCTDSLSRMLIDVLHQLQSVNPASAGLDELGTPDGFLIRAVQGWTKRYHFAAKDVYADRKPPKTALEIIQWLSKQKTPSGEVTLLHNDFKLNNVVLDATDFVTPVALLDWDMCTRGDALFDFATLLSYWIEPSDPPALSAIGQMPTASSPGWMSRTELVHYYAQASGKDVSDIHYYRVLTAFKHCIIFMQIYARYLNGTTSDPRIAKLGLELDGLFEFTHDLMHQRIF